MKEIPERPAVLLAVNGMRDESRTKEMLYDELSRTGPIHKGRGAVHNRRRQARLLSARIRTVDA